MARSVTIAVVMILAAVAASANANEYTFYKPEKVKSGEIPAPGNGVLTRTIVIREGDTLSSLSRRYSGRSSFFPQILLFNKIGNPDLIYAGKTLRVPLTRQESLDAQEEKSRHKSAKAKRAVSASPAVETSRRATPIRSNMGPTGKRLFDRGVMAYVKGHYREAIEIFDRYLAAYPNSADAPEAELYKAECYMKLSGGR